MKFFCAVLSQPPSKALLSDEHFSADGTLVEAWASMKSFKPNGEGDSSDELPAARHHHEAGSAAARQGRNQERDFVASRAPTRRAPRPPIRTPRLLREAKLCHEGHLKPHCTFLRSAMKSNHRVPAA